MQGVEHCLLLKEIEAVIFLSVWLRCILSINDIVLFDLGLQSSPMFGSSVPWLIHGGQKTSFFCFLVF